MKRVRVVVLGYRELSGLWIMEAHAQTALALGFIVITASPAQCAYAQARQRPVLRPVDKHTFMQPFALTLFNALRSP